MRLTDNITTEKIKETILENTCFQIFPNYIEMIGISYVQKRIAQIILSSIYIFFVLKINRLERIQKIAVVYVGVTLLIMHMLNFFCMTGFNLLMGSLALGGIATIVTIRKNMSNYIVYPLGFYLVSLCVFVYTNGLSTYAIIMSTITASLSYLAVTQYLWKTIHYVFLRAVLCTIIVTMLIKTSLVSDFFSLVGEVSWLMPSELAATMTGYLLYLITIFQYVVIGLNEIRNL